MASTKTEKPVLTTQEAKLIADAARPAETPCLCGCGRMTKGRFFPGDDAKLKAILERTAAGKNGGSKHAQRALVAFGWVS
jgi:hypothetical protein